MNRRGLALTFGGGMLVLTLGAWFESGAAGRSMREWTLVEYLCALPGFAAAIAVGELALGLGGRLQSRMTGRPMREALIEASVPWLRAIGTVVTFALLVLALGWRFCPRWRLIELEIVLGTEAALLTAWTWLECRRAVSGSSR